MARWRPGLFYGETLCKHNYQKQDQPIGVKAWGRYAADFKWTIDINRQYPTGAQTLPATTVAQPGCHVRLWATARWLCGVPHWKRLAALNLNFRLDEMSFEGGWLDKDSGLYNLVCIPGNRPGINLVHKTTPGGKGAARGDSQQGIKIIMHWEGGLNRNNFREGK